MIAGLGLDSVEIERVAALLRRRGGRFLHRILASREVAIAPPLRGRSLGEEPIPLFSRRQVEWLAGRFAAKEAVMKALGTGWRAGVGWREIEIGRADSGEPQVRLSGRAAAAAHRRGVGRVWVTITHDREHALAQAIAIRAGAGE